MAWSPASDNGNQVVDVDHIVAERRRHVGWARPWARSPSADHGHEIVNVDHTVARGRYDVRDTSHRTNFAHVASNGAVQVHSACWHCNQSAFSGWQTAAILVASVVRNCQSIIIPIYTAEEGMNLSGRVLPAQ